jgi:hypothetical protein
VPVHLPSVFERVTALTFLTFTGKHPKDDPACCAGLGRLARLRRLDARPLQWRSHSAGGGLELCSAWALLRL